MPGSRAQLSRLCFCLILGACASLPPGGYGVEDIVITGSDQLAAAAIKRCLLTMERSRFGLKLGSASASCQVPPFDKSPPTLDLWTWPWTEWGELNPAVVELDRQRLERFYRARGFYDARVSEVRYEPAAATQPQQEECDPERQRCTVQITFVVHEGQPLVVGEVSVNGLDALSAAERDRVLGAERPRSGRRFDELDYDRGKSSLAAQLAEASYAAATVSGEVRLDHAAKLAHVRYSVDPGPAYRFGAVHVVGLGALPSGPVVAAAGITRGEPYRQSALEEVQQEVYAFGAFSSVRVERVLDTTRRLVDLRIEVKPLEPNAFRLGAGVTAGALQRGDGQVESVPQWDVHLLGSYERRHLLGSLGKLRIEDRPRLIFKRPFPELGTPQLGNILRLRLTQPGWVEARTELSAETVWDYGPDPFKGFLRSDIIVRLAAQRAFLRRMLSARVALQQDVYLVPDSERQLPTGFDESQVDSGMLDLPPASYRYMFVEENLRLDLRDDALFPHGGALILVNLTQSVRSPTSDWTLFKVAPDARVYLALPFHISIAVRVAVAALFIQSAKPKPPGDSESEQLGPQNYRLRGGGAYSNRGFVAGQLGVGEDGGIRRWEASVELRLRIGQTFGFATFFDFGNVTATTNFGFNQPNPAAGFGLRYLSALGTIRGDFGYRLSPSEPEDTLGMVLPDAFHFTIGEAF